MFRLCFIWLLKVIFESKVVFLFHSILVYCKKCNIHCLCIHPLKIKKTYKNNISKFETFKILRFLNIKGLQKSIFFTLATKSNRNLYKCVNLHDFKLRIFNLTKFIVWNLFLLYFSSNNVNVNIPILLPKWLNAWLFKGTYKRTSRFSESNF